MQNKIQNSENFSRRVGEKKIGQVNVSQKKKIKAVFIDLDGTALTERWRLHPENIKAIKEVQERGVKVVFATGRGYPVVDFSEQCDIHKYSKYAIALNGSWIIDLAEKNDKQRTSQKDEVTPTSKVSESMKEKMFTEFHFLPSKVAQDIIKYVKNKKISGWFYSYNIDDHTPRVYNIRTFSLIGILSSLLFKFFDRSKNCPLPSDGEGLRISKVSLICGSKKNAKKVREEVTQLASVSTSLQRITTWRLLKRCDNVVEINPEDVTKLTAIKKLCYLWGISREEVMCIGDSHNDIPMLEWAQYRMVVKNAVKEVKNLATYISKKTNTEGGVADLLRRYIV